jgi:hypothetical protein
MTAIFEFSLDSVRYSISDVRWTSRCSAHFTEPQHPYRRTGSSTGSAEISIYCRKEGELNRILHVRDLDEQISQWRGDGYPCNGDVAVLRHYPKDERWQEFLGVSVALNEPKFSTMQEFLLRHIGRSDLRASVAFSFVGFEEANKRR